MGVFKHKLDAARSAVNLLMSTDFIGLYDTYSLEGGGFEVVSSNKIAMWSEKQWSGWG